MKGGVTVVLALPVHELSAKRLRPLCRVLWRFKTPMKLGSRAIGEDARMVRAAGHFDAQDVGRWEMGVCHSRSNAATGKLMTKATPRCPDPLR